jgi:hypothetical protein
MGELPRVGVDGSVRAQEGRRAILLFDEADAFFGRRSEVTDRTTRYADIEVSYLPENDSYATSLFSARASSPSIQLVRYYRYSVVAETIRWFSPDDTLAWASVPE